MLSSQKINFSTFFAAFTVILVVVFYYVQRKDLAQWGSLLAEERNLTMQEVILLQEEIKAPEIFKPKIVYYNRVGKCGSRSLLSVISKSAGGTVNFVSEPPLYTKFDEKELQNNVTNEDYPLFYTRHIYFTNFSERLK